MIVPSTPYNGILIIIIGVGVSIPLFVWAYKLYKRQGQAQGPYTTSIPTVLTDMDIRREQIINRELDRRIGSGNVSFVFNILWDMYAVLVGNDFPKLPTEMDGKDILDKLPFLMEYIPQATDAIKKLQDPMIKHGEMGTGLLMARSINRYFPIERQIDNDSSYKKLKKKLRTARENLPSAIAPKATAVIDDYLDASKAYKTSAVVIVPLGKMLEDNELLRGVPSVAQIIDRFQAFREQCVRIMNDKLAKVNEALGGRGRSGIQIQTDTLIADITAYAKSVPPMPIPTYSKDPVERDKQWAEYTQQLIDYNSKMNAEFFDKFNTRIADTMIKLHGLHVITDTEFNQDKYLYNFMPTAYNAYGSLLLEKLNIYKALLDNLEKALSTK